MITNNNLLETEADIIPNLGNIRDHHYHFTRYSFYNFFADHSYQAIKLFRFDENLKGIVSEEGTKECNLNIVKNLWYNTYVKIRTANPNVERVDFTGFNYHTVVIDDSKTIVVFTLPMPQAITESYYVGVYLNQLDPNEKPEVNGFDYIFPKAEFRYFTLEYHTSEITAFCKWRNGNHLLYDFYGNLTEKEFLNKIKLYSI